MRRFIALAFAGGIALLPGAVMAWGTPAAHQPTPTDVFVGTSHPFLHHPVDHRFARPQVIIIINEVIVVEPGPKPVWVPPHWHWTDAGLVVVPGHWTRGW